MQAKIIYDSYDLTFESEYADLFLKKTFREGEKGLMLAVLQDGVECFRKYVTGTGRRRKRLFSEAEQWILDRNSDWLFSFENICEVVGINADYLRDGLLHWKTRKLQEKLSCNLHYLPYGRRARLANALSTKQTGSATNSSPAEQDDDEYKKPIPRLYAEVEKPCISSLRCASDS